MDQAESVRGSLEKAMPLAAGAKDKLLVGDAKGAQADLTALAAYTAEARSDADGDLWRFAEQFPIVGPNLAAVRTVTVATDDLADTLQAASGLDLERLAPKEGRIDTAVIVEASQTVDDVAARLDDVKTILSDIDRTQLVSEVSTGVEQLDSAVTQLDAFVGPARDTLALLPGLLGADAPRNYLVLVQNNAESRGSGGNPAALVMITVDNGALSITQQASSTDFDNGRETPVTSLDPQTVALYGDKVGRYMQDATTTPDFTESARVMEAFWAESYGTPVSATLSIDPVALSYLMAATGPVTLPNGDVLTSESVVPTLLNDVYSRYAEPEEQDAYFAAAASAVFGSVTNVAGVKPLIEQVLRAVAEGRILYVPSDDREAAAIAGSRLSGQLPTDNSSHAVLGAYVNDITEGKLDYYLDTAAAVSTDVCTVDDATAPTFTITSTLTSTLQPEAVAGLATYISPARFFPKGVISTDLVLYGPVGSTFVSASVDGAAAAATPVEHLGRPAVKINVLNDPASTHTVTATFTGPAGDHYGPVEVWHTPMVRDTPVTIDAPGCTP